MTKSNRVVNRLLIALFGLLLLGAAAWLGITSWRPDLLQPVNLDFRSTVNIVILVIVLVVVIALATLWSATRGRGKTSTAYQRDGLEIDVPVIEDLLRLEFAGQPDVISIKGTGYQVAGKKSAVMIEFVVRKSANLGVLTDNIRSAVSAVDQQLGHELMIVAHISTGIRSLIAAQKVAA